VKSWGGGCNAILVRGRVVTEHRRLRLRIAPERRVMHAVRLGDGVWVGNLHASAHVEARAVADLERAGAALDRWSAGGPAILGGDTNVREPQVSGYADCGGHVLDHVFARGIACAGPAVTLPRHDAALDANLSDHRPVLATLA
jgi:endonuclease/exonuclease/phosphatase (EEP) superfamily protein YafD